MILMITVTRHVRNGRVIECAGFIILVSGFRHAGVLNTLYLVMFEYNAGFFYILFVRSFCAVNIDDAL
jgi:hypothetical protein